MAERERERVRVELTANGARVLGPVAKSADVPVNENVWACKTKNGQRTCTVRQAQEDLAHLAKALDERARRGGFWATDVHQAKVVGRPWREDPVALAKYQSQRAEVAAGMKPKPTVKQKTPQEDAQARLERLTSEGRRRA